MWKTGSAMWARSFETIGFPVWMRVTKGNLLCRLKQLAFFVLYFPGFLRLVRLLGLPCYKNMADKRVRTQYKHLGDYLIRGMPVINKLGILIHNYKFLSKILSANGSLLGDRGGVCLWAPQRQESQFEIALDVPELDMSFREGEVVLLFSMNSKLVYTLTFTVVPAELIDKRYSGDAILIGGIQGAVGSSELVKGASKAFGEIFPSVILLLAVQALAIAWRIERIFAVSVCNQIAPSVSNNPQRYLELYDHFWEAQGARKFGNYYEFFPLPAEKREEDLSTTHSRRTRRKRELKKQLLQEMIVSVEQRFGHNRGCC